MTWPERVERLALRVHVARWRRPGVVPAARAGRPARRRSGPPSALRVLDTRFTPEWLADHPADRGLAEMMAARLHGGEVRRDAPGRGRRSSTPGAATTCCDRLGAITCPTLVACGRYDGIAPMVEQRGHRRPRARRRAARLRGRPRLLRPGPDGHPRHPRLHRRSRSGAAPVKRVPSGSSAHGAGPLPTVVVDQLGQGATPDRAVVTLGSAERDGRGQPDLVGDVEALAQLRDRPARATSSSRRRSRAPGRPAAGSGTRGRRWRRR